MGRNGYREKVPISEQKKTVFAVVAVGTFALGSIGLPSLFDWLKTKESKSITLAPPTGKVTHYAALVTGTASSDFPVSGTAECAVGSVDISDQWSAKATVANKIGDFVVSVSPDQSAVTIALSKYPQLQSGLKMDQSRTSIDSGWSLCDGQDAIDLTVAEMRTAQATADTIGDCIVQRPDFQESLKSQLATFGEAAYPSATVTVTIPPYDGIPSPAISALESLKQELSSDDITIKSDAVDNCEFKEFTMTPIVFTEGSPNG